MSSNSSANPWQLSSRTISVLVPALDEEKNLAGTVERLIRALKVTVEDYEIIIVNDGSTDGTQAIAEKLSEDIPEVRLHTHDKNLGLGVAYRTGVNAASMTYFVYIPGDNTWPYTSLLELFARVGSADVVTSYSTNPEARRFGRRLVSSAFTRVTNAAFNRSMRYYNGLTIYPIEFLKQDPITTFGFGFQAEALLKALDAGLSYLEVPLAIDEHTSSRSKAVNARNIFSVLGTLARLFYDLRLTNRWKRHVHEAAKRGELTVGLGATTVAEEIGFEGVVGSEGASLGDEKNLNIVIAGASTGIGAALAIAFANDGHRIWICARNEDDLKRIASESSLIDYVVCDMSQEANVQRFAEKVSDAEQHVDVLINCAGTFGEIGPVESCDASLWAQTISVNLVGPFLSAKLFLPLLTKSNRPRIINFSGGGAFSPFPNFSAYACSKAALVRLTECLSAELAPKGIAVNAVAPGIVATQVHNATLEAGPERAGRLQYRRTQAVMSEGGAPMENVINCVRKLMSPAFAVLTGKTISANFDPWETGVFQSHIRAITSSDLYTLRRMNVSSLPEGELRERLTRARSEQQIS